MKIAAAHDLYIGNIIAFILAALLFAANCKKHNGTRREHGLLMFLLANVGFYGIVEIASCIFEGIPGIGMTILLYALNSELFIINILLGYGWMRFIAYHLGYTIPKHFLRAVQWSMTFALLLLVINLFRPLVFSLEDNVYSDGPLYFLYLLIGVLFLGYSVHVYLICKRNGGVLKYFPIWMYIVPIVSGIVLEELLGSAFMSACNAIAVSAVLGSLEDEQVFRDRLTGLYNRAYLEEIKTKLEKADNSFVSGIMLDLNGLKSINDHFGHQEGDQALITSAELIRKAVGSYGDVIRYAGDEFVVILNTCDEEIIGSCSRKIEAAFEEHNRNKETPYELSASMGCASFNAGKQTVNEFLNTIDRNMYESKREYYRKSANDRRERRSKIC